MTLARDLLLAQDATLDEIAGPRTGSRVMYLTGGLSPCLSALERYRELVQMTHDRPLAVAGGCRHMTALAYAFSQFRGGQGQDRTVDLPLFRRTLIPTELPDLAGCPMTLSGHPRGPDGI